MKQEWYYVDLQGEKQGPIRTSQLVSMAKKGEITPESYVRKGTGKWVRARKVQNLFRSSSEAASDSGSAKANAGPSPEKQAQPHSDESQGHVCILPCPKCGARTRYISSENGESVRCSSCGTRLSLEAARKARHLLFISHSSSEQELASAICEALEGHGFECWIAPRDVEGGASWAKSIVNAIVESRVLVLLLSDTAMKSPQVLREVERAVSNGVSVIPIRLDSSRINEDFEYFLSATHWLDCQGDGDAEITQTLLPLVETLITKTVVLGNTELVRRKKRARSRSFLVTLGVFLLGGVLASVLIYLTVGPHRSHVANDLAEQIMMHCEPAEWEDLGGPGSISISTDSLQISTLLETHEQIHNFLNGIRGASGRPQMPLPTLKPVNAQRLYERTQDETKVRFLDSPLDEVVSYLSDIHEVSIEFDYERLEDVGLTPDRMYVTCDLSNLTLADALRTMLREWDCTFAITESAILIVTNDRIGYPYQQTLSYDIRDFLDGYRGWKLPYEGVRFYAEGNPTQQPQLSP